MMRDEEATTARATQGGGQADERELTDEQRAALIREQLQQLHTIEVAHDMMITLVTLGYQKLGLTDETRDLRNLDDARLAIEILGGIIDAVAGVGGEEPVASFRGTLAQMKLNYARVALQPQTDESTGGKLGPQLAGQETAAATGESVDAPAPAAEAAEADDVTATTETAAEGAEPEEEQPG